MNAKLVFITRNQYMLYCSKTFSNQLVFQSLHLDVHDECYFRNVSCALRLKSTLLFFCCYYHWVETSAGGLVFPECITRPVHAGHFKSWLIRVITKLPNSEQSYKGKVKIWSFMARFKAKIPDSYIEKIIP